MDLIGLMDGMRSRAWPPDDRCPVFKNSRAKGPVKQSRATEVIERIRSGLDPALNIHQKVPTMVTQLIYYSRNTTPGGDREMLAQLREILSKSQANNGRDNVTGYLIFDKTWFVQILEGERETVQATYNRIAGDSRHGAVTVLDLREVKSRQFPSWSMGGALRTLDVQEIFLEHGIGGPIDPTRLNAQKVVDLALDLCAFDESKRARRAG